MNYNQLKEYINSNKIDDILKKIICDDNLTNEKQRYLSLLDKAYQLYGDGDYHFISSPGRSEMGGNHTDHQHGHCVAASLNIDDVCVVKPNEQNIVNYVDLTFGESKLDLSDLDVHEEEKNTHNSLIRGVAARFNQLGYKIGGFDAVCQSKVLGGSGISSSACFEVMMAEIFNGLYNDEKVSDVDRAIIGQYAENVYFGKPSGLLDQTAISVGGFVTIDFKDGNKPVVNNYDFSLSDAGYELLLVNTKGDHSDLSHEYAAVPNEMRQVGKLLGVDFLADSSMDKLLANIKDIRETVKNDRAVLRAFHFFNEDKRAVEIGEACKNKDVVSLLKLMNESGRSSYEYLQNVYPASRPTSQALALGLALSDYYLQGKGAYRVHGGGFDGTIQVVVPKDMLEGYKKFIGSVFGEDSLLQIRIRPFGTKLVI